MIPTYATKAFMANIVVWLKAILEAKVISLRKNVITCQNASYFQFVMTGAF